MLLRRTASLAGLVALSLGLGACGNKHEPVTKGETEGIYVDVGPMKYQVQVSRQLNPAAIPEDRSFVRGIASADAGLRPDEAWFAVFVRIQNESGDPQPPATAFEVVDTEDVTYEPVALSPANDFRYPEDKVRGHAVVPTPDSVAGQTSINGVLLLFKVKVSSLEENRPLVLKIHSPVDPGQEAEIDLDV